MRKKGARAHFDRRKNDERHRQQARKGSISRQLASEERTSHPLCLTPDVLPQHWQKLSDGKYCKVQERSDGLGEVVVSLVIELDSNVHAYVAGKRVPNTSNVLTKFQSCSNEQNYWT